MTAAGITSANENISAAEGYLAGARFAAGAAPVRPRRRWWPWPLWARPWFAKPWFAKPGWQRLQGWSFWGWMGALGLRPAPCPRMLSVAERLDLGAKRALLVVHCGERRFLVAVGAEGVSAMLEMQSPQREPRRRRTAAASWRGRRC